MHRTLVFFYIKLKYFALISQSYAALVFCVLFLIREMRRADVPIKPSLCLGSHILKCAIEIAKHIIIAMTPFFLLM